MPGPLTYRSQSVGRSRLEADKTREEDAIAEHRGSWRPIAVVIVLIVVVAIGAYWLFTRGPGARLVSPAGSTVAQFRGSGDRITEAFSVREGWSIHWENTGDRFAFAISGDRDLGTVVEQEEPASGVTSPVGGGTFRLEITAEGPWSVRIVQGE